jgi:predicted metal-dependent hydrolase
VTATVLPERAILDGREVIFRLRRVKSARALRIRVGPHGVEVICPVSRTSDEAEEFLRANGAWVTSQLDRIAALRSVRRAQHVAAGEILFEGLPCKVDLEQSVTAPRSNRVTRRGDVITVRVGTKSPMSPAKSLERWLRKEARRQIECYVARLAVELDVAPRCIYIMDQRTKWGNCSPLNNLSFSWRIIMAPEHVLRYLVTHEVVHLAVPDHSQRFWLTVQSLCPEAEQARQWLAANGQKLYVDLNDLVESA